MAVTTDAKSEREFSDRYLLSVFWSYVKRHRGLFNLVVIALILNVSLALTSPLIFNYVLEGIEEGTDLSSKFLIYAIAGYVVFSILSWFLRAIQFMSVAKLNARIVGDIRVDAYSSVLDNSISFFDKRKSGELTSRLINDTKELHESGRELAWFFTSLFRISLTLVIFFYFSITIALTATLFLPIILAIAIFLGKYERRVTAIWRAKFGEVNNRFAETMSKIQISKAFNREKENLERFGVLNEATYKASVKRGFVIFIFWPITDVMQHALLLLILYVGTREVENGMPIATLILFLILKNQFYWPLVTMANTYHRFQGAFASLERISRISRDPDLAENDKGTLLAENLTGSIKFDRVNFAYNTKIPILQDISFEINPGDRIALVGHTGAGKSTVASLLMRFYEINDGSITFDNKNLYDYDLKSLRKNISLVSQRVLLFKGTIRDNLQIANPIATDNEIWDVLDKVQAREFIEMLPNDLDTIVEEKGKNLSAGQRQMISFARALLSDPRIIILDEATASVDLYTESKIQDAIDTLLDSRTSISIAHRLTTILKSDKIIVLEHGKIVQMGNHEELMKQGGLYENMYKLYLETQSAKYLNKIKTSV
ncbi:MAG: putative ABC transporter ATP-binding protein [Candidatus Heimdallarchaeota archaeon LC_2]|nr:MAG: putative ABC transporter ATP-binding protein [Candidatus Heimdallarchaeota archaeon LC_2]